MTRIEQTFITHRCTIYENMDLGIKINTRYKNFGIFVRNICTLENVLEFWCVRNIFGNIYRICIHRNFVIPRDMKYDWRITRVV